MPRFAVLHDLSTEDTVPVGLALERDDHVLVYAPADFGIQERQNGEYRVLDPEMAYVAYKPGDTGYFEQVLGSISWAFGVGEVGTVQSADDEMLLKLIVHKIDRPREESLRGTYDVPLTIVRSTGGDEVRFVQAKDTVYCADQEELAIAARGGIVAV
jgi:hypothetical protein